MKLSDIPNLLKEFHLTKNSDLKPINLSYESSKKVWWQCNNNNKHAWHACISDGTYKRSGCPICYKEKNRKLSIKTNDIRQKELII